MSVSGTQILVSQHCSLLEEYKAPWFVADYKTEQRKHKHGTMSEVAMSQLEEALIGQI